MTSAFLLGISVSILGIQPGQRTPVLGPDDRPAFPAPVTGFDLKKEGIPHGELHRLEYDSKSVGTRRKMVVYTPPEFSRSSRYPVLYLLHGIGGTEEEWPGAAAPAEILDSLIARGKTVPMIVVMPNGRARKNDRAEGNVFESAPAFGEFDKDLLGSIIPFIDRKFPTISSREGRALAGLSMGGGQSLNFGLANTDVFGYVGGFSSAPNTYPPDKLIGDGAQAKTLKLLWVSCGDQDGLLGISQGVHKRLKELNVPHIWHVEPGPHNFPVWKADLYWFSQLLFKQP